MIEKIGLIVFSVKYLVIYLLLFFLTLEVVVHDSIFKGQVGKSTLIKCLFVGGDYEPSLVNLLENIVKKGDVFIDLGANEGFFSIIGSLLIISIGIPSISFKVI